MIRQKDIANAVGVDVSTVNKILSGHPSATFSEETIDKVFRTCEQLGYPVKTHARKYQELIEATKKARELLAQNKNTDALDVLNNILVK